MEVIDDLNALQALEPEWRELWLRAPNATPFQSPHWLMPWWKAFGSDGLHVLVQRDGNRLTALAPLYILRDDDESLGMLLGTGISDYLDMLSEQPGETPEILAAMNAADCQMWDLQQLRSSSPLLATVVPEGASENVEEQDRCPVLDLSAAGIDLENLLSTHARKKVRYYRRLLAREGTVVTEPASEENLETFLDALFELHAARWAQRNLPGVLADEVTQDFHRDAARRLLKEGALRMYATKRDGKIVAVFYGFAHQGTVCYYLSGYDPGLERLSIGTLIVAHAIEEAVREGATTFDFLRGAEEYKYTWGATDRINKRRQLFPAPR